MITTELTTVEVTTDLLSNVITTNITAGTQIATTLAVVGPQGPQGPAGDIANSDQFFFIANRFSELDTPQKKTDARTNLELQYIDCGTFN